MEPIARGGLEAVISGRKPNDRDVTIIEGIAIGESGVTTICHLTVRRQAVRLSGVLVGSEEFGGLPPRRWQS